MGLETMLKGDLEGRGVLVRLDWGSGDEVRSASQARQWIWIEEAKGE